MVQPLPGSNVPVPGARPLEDAARRIRSADAAEGASIMTSPHGLRRTIDSVIPAHRFIRLLVLAAVLALAPASATTAEQAPQERTPLTTSQQDQLLALRLKPGIGDPFDRFANRFLVTTRISIPYGIALVSREPKISDAPLQSPFPAFYEPTVREILDAIALQTFSTWTYDPTSAFIKAAPGTAPD